MAFSERSTGSSLQERLVYELGQKIVRGDLAPGAVISTDLVQRDYEVSRNVVRESLRALEVRGLVVARPKIGTIVQPRTLWALLDPLVIKWRGTAPDADEQLREMLLLREAIEPAVARAASLVITDSQLDQLAAELESMRKAARESNTAEFARADTAFHRGVHAYSGSELMAQLFGTLDAALQTRYARWRVDFGQFTQESLRLHEELWEALANHDGDRAWHAARLLVEDARAELMGGHGGAQLRHTGD